MNEKLFSLVNTSIKKLAEVCTDGANGKYEGFIDQLTKKKHWISVHSFHCIIHQTSLASKFLTYHQSMKTLEKIINKIRKIIHWHIGIWKFF